MTCALRIPLLILALWKAADAASGGEVRATWIARDGLTSKESLASAMDRAASNHFNVVFVNAWSRGYPLWRSQVFSNETGLAIDPTYSSRDIMAEAVAEGHRNGLHVLAWFEYGFVGGWTGYLPGSSGKGKVFDAHPDWVARQQNGTEIDGSSFYWMTHTRPEVQSFLIRLAGELAANYDLDGIELDRIRYSSLNYGYDDFTKSLYAAEHGGQQPPTKTDDPAWIRWRADKLNQFHAAAYDGIKDLYPRFAVANAPSAYSSSQYSAYNSFCQDWVWWVNNGKVDSIELQSYVSTASSFSNILNFVATQVSDVKRINPSFALRPNSVWIAYPETLKFVDTARADGFGGQSVWYYTDLTVSNYFPNFQMNRYQTPVEPELWPGQWRAHRALVMITNTADAVRTGSWIQSANAGFSGPSLYATAGTPATVDYFLDVPTNGIYEVYAYQVISSSRATNAPWKVFDALGGTVTNGVNQTQSANSRWYKLGDVLLAPGRQRVVQLSNQGIAAGKQVSADAVMISLHRRLSEPPVIAGASTTTNHHIAIALRGNVGQRFLVQASTNLLDWTTRANLTITNSPTVWSDPNTSSVPAQFYRAALAP